MIYRISIVVAILVMLTGIPTADIACGKIQFREQTELSFVLDKCAEYCERLNNTVLDFVCKEKIVEVVNLGKWRRNRRALSLIPEKVLKKKLLGEPSWMDLSNLERKEYVYDYQLLRKNTKSKIEEMRMQIDEEGSYLNKKNARLKTRFAHKNLVFAPVTVLSRSMQTSYDFRILQEEENQHSDFVVIEAIPKKGTTSTHLYGKYWVSRNDYSIKKAIWNQKAIVGYNLLNVLAADLGCTPSFTLKAEFEFEKNGVRFPSFYSLEETYIDEEGTRLIKSRKTVKYFDYKFFTVEVEIKRVE